jgi:GrpB-like predicted nucleotidyltransferase (UPF0157 family)
MEGVERYKIRLLPHNKKWADEYRQVKRQIEQIWNDNIMDIQHVGSTAIKNIPAKPILDIAVRLKSIQYMDVDAFMRLGYEYCGPRGGCDTYHLYILRGENHISLRHIHCYDASNHEFFQLVGFRDYLNSHPDVAMKYSELKKKLAFLYSEDRETYTKGKEDFIKNIYAALDYKND